MLYRLRQRHGTDESTLISHPRNSSPQMCQNNWNHLETFYESSKPLAARICGGRPNWKRRLKRPHNREFRLGRLSPATAMAALPPDVRLSTIPQQDTDVL